jgi:hypothetical protein
VGFFYTSLRLSQWALEAMLIPRVLVVIVLTLISLTLAAIKQRPFQRKLWKPYHWLVLTQLLFFPAVIAAGVVWANPVTNPTVPHFEVYRGRGEYPLDTAPVWRYIAKGSLDGPQVVAVERFRKAIDESEKQRQQKP